MSGVGKTQLALQLCLTAQISIGNENEIKGIEISFWMWFIKERNEITIHKEVMSLY